MFSTRSEYDRGVNTFSPEGRLFQVEYALGAIKLGSTAIGIRTNEGVVLASERRVTSCLLEPQSVEKILEVDRHIGCAMSGLIADARTLIDHARVECANHHFTYNEPLSVHSCVDAIADLALDFSDVSDGQRKKVMSRPFGVALLVGGVDAEGASLWSADPSGTVTQHYAAAIGSAQEGAETMLQEQYHKNMTYDEAEKLALVVLRQVMEDRLTQNNIEIAGIRKSDGKYHSYTAEEVKGLIERLPAPAIPTVTELSSGTA